MECEQMEIRDYRDSDYEACESLVNGAWDFDRNFEPQKLSDIAKCMYTRGSVIGSNFRKVAVIDKRVAGFLFGLNEVMPEPKGGQWFGWKTLGRILCVRGMSFKEKRRLLEALVIHDRNRTKVVGGCGGGGSGRSEVVLFVVDPSHQGRGVGRRLLSEFIDQCRCSGVESIIVETNKSGASGFYEEVGFKHLGDFDSPLHEYATKEGQACMYEFSVQRDVDENEPKSLAEPLWG